MFDSFIASTGEYIHQAPGLALLAVFTAGILTAASPCVLAMIPLMMAYVAGQKDRRRPTLVAFGYSLLFILGLSMAFTAMGMLVALAGQVWGDIPSWWNWIVALVCLLMGLHLSDLIQFRIPSLTRYKPEARGALGALVLGLMFGFVSAPCAAPILIVLLTYLAGSGASIVYGGTLLFVYGLGHSMLILIAGTSVGLAQKMIDSTKLQNTATALRRVAGGIIIITGLYFAWLAGNSS